MANKIRIKRKKLNDGSDAPLVNNNNFKWGEIAYNEDGDILYYGGGSGDLNQDNASRIVPIAGSGQYVLRDGSNATGTWNISVSAATNAVYTTGTQTIGGVKTFSNRPIFSSGLSVSSVDSTSNSGLFLPVFTGNPSSTQQTLFTRTPSQFKSDIGLGNVENTALSSYSRAGIDSRTSFPPETHNITSHTGTNWQVFYTNGSNQVVGLGLGSSGQVLKSNGTTNAPSWQTDNDTVYTHPTQTAITESAADGKVLSAIGVNTLGHVTGVGTKTLAEDDIPTLSQSKISNLTTDLANKLPLTGGTLTGFLTLHADPTSDNHAATKRYVDAVKQGLDVKQSVKAIATELYDIEYNANDDTLNGSFEGVITIDGVSLASGDRILIQTSDDNRIYGIWEVHNPGAAQAYFLAVRPDDFDSNNDVTAGAFTFVEQGTNHGDTGWVLTSNDPVYYSGAQVWTQFSAAGQIYDGSGLVKVGNYIHVGQGDGISVSVDSVAVNSTVLRTSGVQTVTGDKDFGNSLLIKPTKNASSAFFPAFAVEPSGSSQRLTYMTKSELVTALSFETPELGNSFVNTTGNQTISGVKRFEEESYFQNGHQTILSLGGRLQPIGNINLLNSNSNSINFNASGVSAPPTRSDTYVSGTKIVFQPLPVALAAFPPIAMGCSSNSLWNVIPASSYNYEWYAGQSKIANLSGNGTFETTTIKSTNLYLGGTQISSTASEINLLSSANENQILIGNSVGEFAKSGLISVLDNLITSESGLAITSNASNLIINHNLSPANSTSNSSPYTIQNLYIDDYGHITGVSNLDLSTVFLQASDLNTTLVFTNGLGSSYDSGSTTLTVVHSGGNKTAGEYGGNGIKSITLDNYGHIYDISTATYVASGDLCTAISNCTIDGGTY